jgi:hypothetical protein
MIASQNIDVQLQIESLYTLDEIQNFGLTRNRDVVGFNAAIYFNNDHVFFFEYLPNAKFRLYSIIKKKSFYL